MFKLCTNKNHSYKHNEQINNQDINNSECFDIKNFKIDPKKIKNMVLIDYIWIFFTCCNTFVLILYM